MALAELSVVNNEIVIEVGGTALLAPMVAAAAGHASAANDSAALAEQWANEGEDVVVTGGEYSAKHYSIKASAAAGTAATDAAAAVAAAVEADRIAAQEAETGAVAAAASVSGVVNSLEAIETIGRPVASPPVTGTALSTNTYIFGTPVTNTGVLETVRAWGLAGGSTLKLRKFTKSGDTFTQSGSDVNVVLTAGAGLKTVTVSLAVTAGDYIGFYVPANSISRNTATGDSGGYYSPSVAADSTSFTDTATTTSILLEIGFDIAYQYVTATRSAANVASITTLQTDSANYALRLPVLEGSNATQIIGKPTAPVAGSTTSAGTYVFVDPAIGDGRITQIQVWSGSSPGTAQIKIFSTANGTHTQVGADIPWVLTANSLNTYSTSIAILKGQRVGIYVPATGSMHRVVATSFGGGYDSLGASNLTTGTAASAPTTTNQFQITYTLAVNRPDRQRVTLQNSDRVVCLGDSFTAAQESIRGKSWLFKASAFTDLLFDNFGVSGNTAAEVLTRLRGNTATLGVFRYRDRAATYALIYIGQNDFAATTSLADFLADMVHLIEHVKGFGATPILVAPHSLDAALYGQGFSLIYRQLAEEHGCYFVDVAENARANDYGTRYGGFWDGTHPGTRTNQIIAGPITALLERLETRQSIKVFRKRSGVTVSTINDLLFNNRFQRAKLFKEILIGTGALLVASESKADVLNTYTGADTELLSSEYQTLINGGTIAVDDYSLVEVTLPTLAKHIDQLKLTINETAATVYCREIHTGTVTDGVADGAWVALNGSSGVYRLCNDEIKRFMRGDKISFLIYKSGGIASFAAPTIEWFGEHVEKPAKVSKTIGRRALGAEKLTTTDLGVSTNWTATGTVSHGVPTDACLPIDSTGRVTVDNTNYVSQAVTYTADNTQSREVEIRVNARVFPTIGSLTQDGFDWGQIQIEVGTGAGRVPYVERVGLWWGDIVLRTIAPLGTSGLTLYIRGASGSQAIEASKASFKFVDA